MEKALEFLIKLKQSRDFDGNLEYSLDEAISELEEAQLTRREWYQKGYNEAMKPKTCEGCKYQKIDIDRCDFCKRCYSDQYEPKDNK